MWRTAIGWFNDAWPWFLIAIIFGVLGALAGWLVNWVSVIMLVFILVILLILVAAMKVGGPEGILGKIFMMLCLLSPLVAMLLTSFLTK